MSKEQFYVEHYVGDIWGVFDKDINTPLKVGTQKQMQEWADAANALNKTMTELKEMSNGTE